MPGSSATNQRTGTARDGSGSVAVTADHEPEDMDHLLDLIPDIAALSRASP